MTEERLKEIFEKSKDDKSIIVGSEVRALIAEVRGLLRDEKSACERGNRLAQENQSLQSQLAIAREALERIGAFEGACDKIVLLHVVEHCTRTARTALERMTETA